MEGVVALRELCAFPGECEDWNRSHPMNLGTIINGVQSWPSNNDRPGRGFCAKRITGLLTRKRGFALSRNKTERSPRDTVLSRSKSIILSSIGLKTHPS